MCTVTFVPNSVGVFITSNRDEHSTRAKATVPTVYQTNNFSITMPIDPDGKGSWIALRNTGDALVLLNGGFENHTPKPSYAESRGIVVKEMVECENPLAYFSNKDLSKIQPFTIVLFYRKHLYELVWTGNEKCQQQLSANAAHIWSSATLYTDAIRNQRKQWFKAWLQKYPNPTQQAILHFHRFTGTGDATNDLFMNRNGLVGTVSITSIAIEQENYTMHYWDAATDKHIENTLLPQKMYTS